MATPRAQRRAAIAWATNTRYPSRVHMSNGRGLVSLCGFPVTAVTHERPHDLRVCPDCAIAYVEESFPLDGAVDADGGDAEWFRQLPPGLYPINVPRRTGGRRWI